MGRKAIPRSKLRQVVTVSLPPHLISRVEHARGKITGSSIVEMALIHALKDSQSTVEDYEVFHVWECLKCGNEWRTNRPKARTITCASWDCQSHKIKHLYEEQSGEVV